MRHGEKVTIAFGKAAGKSYIYAPTWGTFVQIVRLIGRAASFIWSQGVDEQLSTEKAVESADSQMVQLILEAPERMLSMLLLPEDDQDIAVSEDVLSKRGEELMGLDSESTAMVLASFFGDPLFSMALSASGLREKRFGTIVESLSKAYESRRLQP